MGLAGIPLLLLACAGAPPTPDEDPPQVDYWLVLEPLQDVRRSWPAAAARSIPVPAVETLGLELHGIHVPATGTLLVGSVHLPIDPRVRRVVLDADVGFTGLEPYQRVMVAVTGPHNRTSFRARLRAVPEARFLELSGPAGNTP